MLKVAISSDLTAEIPSMLGVLLEQVGRKHIVRVDLHTHSTCFQPEEEAIRITFDKELAPHIHEFRISICGLPCGFPGSGPTAFVECMRAIGIKKKTPCAI